MRSTLCRLEKRDVYPPGGTKGSYRSKPGTRKPKVHWNVLGLQDPAVTSSTPSIDDIRRQIISASGAGLSPETLARAQTKGASRHSGPKAVVPIRKRGARPSWVSASRPVSKGGYHPRTRKNDHGQTRSRTRPATEAAGEGGATRPTPIEQTDPGLNTRRGRP